LSPDGAWISEQRVASFSPGERRTYRTVRPDVAVEIKSDTDDRTRSEDRRLPRGGHSLRRRNNPDEREVDETGSPPSALALDFDAIFDA
jgi:Uma2 family endonuclease